MEHVEVVAMKYALLIVAIHRLNVVLTTLVATVDFTVAKVAMMNVRGVKMTKREITQKFRHTKRGVLTNLYHAMKARSEQKGYGEIPFDLAAFHKWADDDDDFHRLFAIWEFDNFSKQSKPSVDRIDPNVGYEFSNMQWLSWNENYFKGIQEVASKKTKPVNMLKNGEIVGTFKSVDDARIFLGMKSNGNISENLRGKRKTVKGYTFEYVHQNPELLRG